VFGSGSSAGGDDEFDRSLGDFDGIMQGEQEAIARTGGGTAADEALGGAANPGGSGAGAGEAGAESAGAAGNAGAGGADESGSEGGGSADAVLPEEDAITVAGCTDSDKVARQICEAATEEQDPFLRANLWEEYNEWKKILARQ
jgi:hypothetical protein